MTEAETFSWPCSRQLAAQLAAIRPFKRGGGEKRGGRRKKGEKRGEREKKRRKEKEGRKLGCFRIHIYLRNAFLTA